MADASPIASSSSKPSKAPRGRGAGPKGRGRATAIPINLADVPDSSNSGGRQSSDATDTSPRGRGRGKSRGGLGKYLRARGRGRGSGRPAEFHERLLLESDRRPDDDDDEEAEEERRERALKYSRRKLDANVDRYKEEEVELDEDGEPIVPPEVDLSSFLERQRLSDDPVPQLTRDDDEDDVDHSLAHISSRGIGDPNKGKSKVEEVEWNDELDEMTREKAIADANRELTSRFREKSEKLRKKPIAPSARERKLEASYVVAPALPTHDKEQDPKDEMQDFLDDLLT